MAQLTTSAVAEMESELTLARADNIHIRTQLALMEQERDAARVELALMTGRAHDELIRATQLDTILSQVSLGLVEGLKKMQDQKRRLQDQRKAEQERQLGVGQNGASPVYAPRKAFTDGGLVHQAHESSATVIARGDGSDTGRAPQWDRQPIERLGPPRPRASLMDSRNEPVTNIIDDRLPKVELRNDDDELRELASNIKSERQ